jgi:hypothetical protein
MRGAAAAVIPGDRAAAAGPGAGRGRRRAVPGAMREFQARLYGCLTARPDAVFDLVDAILCPDHAVTSLAGLVASAGVPPRAQRADGALAAGRIDEEKLAVLLAVTLPKLVDGDEGDLDGMAGAQEI